MQKLSKINSKAKGNAGELEFVKILKKRFNSEAFSRVPSSGAWGGGQNRQKRDGMSIEQKLTLVADIMTPPEFKFVIEHKFYAEASFWDLFNDSSKFREWATQVSGDAKFVGKEPLLVMKFNRKGRIAMVRNMTVPNTVFDWFYNGDRWSCLKIEDFLELEDNFFMMEK